MYQPINPLAGQPGSFQAFLTASDEAIRNSVKGALVARAAGTECPRCRGQGYVNADLRTGCSTCHGIGRIHE